MKKSPLILLVVLCPIFLQAQYAVRIIVSTVATKPNDAIYAAGSFNSWNAADNNAKLKPFAGGRRVIVFDNLPAATYEYKFTRGDWSKVETNAQGGDIENRTFTVTGDTSFEVAIAGWKDDFPDKPKPNTASANVHLLDSAFFIPQLNRHRRIWIYLPASYQTEKNKSYAVLYMHDGQNLFNVQTAGLGMEWGVDECLDTLAAQLHKECIVVGIDNGDDKRMNEYDPYDNEKYGKGEGKQYIDFIANTLKPFVDKNYRTLKDANHTFIAGSSMGGLISLYALIAYPNVFGGAGVFSPSFWIAPQLYNDVTNVKWQKSLQVYLYAGEKESNRMVIDMQRMFNIFKQKNCCRIDHTTFPLGQHNEKYWRDEFDDFYRWLNL